MAAIAKTKQELDNDSGKLFVRQMKEAGYDVETITITNAEGKSREYLRINGDYLLDTVGALKQNESEEPKMGILFEIVNEKMGVVFYVRSISPDYLRQLQQKIAWALHYHNKNEQEPYIQ